MAGTSWHSSGAKIDTDKLDKQAKENYETIAQTIRLHGWDHPTYPADKVLTYGELRTLLGDAFSGLGTLLKNMKASGLLDFHSHAVLKDDVEVTVINDPYQEFHSHFVLLYGDIRLAIKGDDSGHLKVTSW